MFTYVVLKFVGTEYRYGYNSISRRYSVKVNCYLSASSIPVTSLEKKTREESLSNISIAGKTHNRTILTPNLINGTRREVSLTFHSVWNSRKKSRFRHIASVASYVFYLEILEIFGAKNPVRIYCFSFAVFGAKMQIFEFCS